MESIRNKFRTIVQAVSVFSMCVCMRSYADDGVSNLSIRPQAQSRTIDIFADALYWYTSETVDWAFTLTNSPNSERASYKAFTFDWAPGFRVGLGYNMEHDHWDTQLSYTWFQSRAKDHTRGAVTSAFLAARLSFLEPFSTGKARLDLRYNVGDWDLARSFLVSNYLVLRPSIGLKGGTITQTIHSDWTIPKLIGFFDFAASENIKHRFQGAGPKGGITGKWCLGNTKENYFSLIGIFEASYLWGKWKIRDRFEDNLLTEIRIKTSERNFGAFVLHAFMGFGWDCNYHCDQSHFSVKLGYEIQDWFNQFQIYSDASGSQNNDLILQGFDLSIRFDF